MKIEFDAQCTAVNQDPFGGMTTTVSMREPRQLSGGGLIEEASIILRGDRMKVGSLAKITIEIAD